MALLALSAALHSRGVSPDAELAVLALCVFPFWAVVDRTVMTAVLAVLVALTAPACELLLMNGPGLWHYPTAENVALDFGGPPLLLAHSLPVWVAACYGGYTVWVAALARWLAVWS